MKKLIISLLALLATANIAIAQEKVNRLPGEAAAALRDAYFDEAYAEAFYKAVIDKFGPVRPFSNIVNAERQHQHMLSTLLARYTIPMPAIMIVNRTPVPATLKQACQEGVKAEIANRDLYQKLLPAVKDYPDITQVFIKLRDASQKNHLPALERCGARRHR